MEDYIQKLPNNFDCCIFIYNNLYKSKTHPEFSRYLCVINDFYNHNLNLFFYIKVLIIQKIISLSGENVDINYSSVPDKELLTKNNTSVNYINSVLQIIIENRKSVFHKKTNTMFLVDLLNDAKNVLKDYQSIVVNSTLVYLFDVCTYEI